MENWKQENVPKPFALVTGASQGLGRAMADELANRKINLLLTALPGEGLPDLTQSLRSKGIEAHSFETDLSKKENVRHLAQWANGFPLFALINNAGRGGTRPFLEAEGDYLDSIIQLNIRATALLTHLLLPNLLQQKKSYLLNVASMAAFTPMGYKTVYPASKRFVQHFSAGLREELKGTGLSVSVLFPGAMMTNEDASQRIERQGFLGKLGLLTTGRIAEIAIQGILKGKAEIVPGRANFITAKLLAILPEKWAVRWLTKAIMREVDR